MHTFQSPCPGTDVVDLPTVDDTIAAITVLGCIVDELRTRLATAERAVTVLESEKLALGAEIRALTDHAALRADQPPKVRTWEAPLDEAMLALIKTVDTSFGRAAAHH